LIHQFYLWRFNQADSKVFALNSFVSHVELMKKEDYLEASVQGTVDELLLVFEFPLDQQAEQDDQKEVSGI
jgi:hypothetical protein